MTDKISGVTPTIPNAAVNLPATVSNTAGGALGLSLGSLTDSYRLDVVLSALETKKHAKVISSPRVVTMNNQEARIEQGQEVPYQTVSDAGTKIEFKDAFLKLSVTPQITFDKNIIMNMLVSNDTPLLDAVTKLYIINKKQATTSVLVKNGDTAVIGGIYTNNDIETLGAVPWFHEIPGLGVFFKDTTNTKERTELIIFITPRIVPITYNEPVGVVQ
jgi:type IV pilus assembly protein PilQ